MSTKDTVLITGASTGIGAVYAEPVIDDVSPGGPAAQAAAGWEAW